MPRAKPKKELESDQSTDIRKFNLDPWQERVIRHQGNIVLRTGRQVGKSTVVSLKAYYLAKEFKGSTTLVIAASQRQSSLLFEKIRAMFENEDRENLEKLIKEQNKTFSTVAKKREWERKHSLFEDEPTQTRIRLKNGSIIYCLPTGKTGAFIRGFTADFVIADEAARIPDEVFRVAVMPMLMTTRKLRKTGWIILLSTPFLKQGFFYESCHDKDFLHIHISSEKCPRIPKKELKKQKAKLTAVEYAQEYLGEFVEAYRQFFPDKLIKACTKFKNWGMTSLDKSKNYFLGVDVARYGRDKNAFVIAEIDKSKKVKVIHSEISYRKALTDTAGKIEDLNSKFNFKKIYIDGTGVGGGVIDMLLESPKLKRKIVETNNASRSISQDREKKTLKEDMYSNAKVLMEQGKIEIKEDYILLKSLKSMYYDYNSFGNLIISGKDSHLAEAFVRAVWGIKESKVFFIY
ncbi:MAG: terminase large subunit domain-containing protein [Elusimicrobiota bacterium]